MLGSEPYWSLRLVERFFDSGFAILSWTMLHEDVTKYHCIVLFYTWNFTILHMEFHYYTACWRRPYFESPTSSCASDRCKRRELPFSHWDLNSRADVWTHQFCGCANTCYIEQHTVTVTLIMTNINNVIRRLFLVITNGRALVHCYHHLKDLMLNMSLRFVR